MANKFYLTDKFEYDGLWWLPEHPEKQIHGKFIFDPDDAIYLKLTGSFETEEDTWNSNPYEQTIIHGVTIGGEFCTLVDNTRVSWSHPPPGIYNQRIRSQVALFGHHFSTKDDLFFSSYAISYENLEEWLKKNPFKVEVVKGENQNLIKGYNINFVIPDPIEVPINCKNGILRIAFAFNNEQDRFQSFKVTNEAFIVFQANSDQSLDWYRKLFFDIERLLILLMGGITRPRRIEGYLKKNPNEKRKKRIEIYQTLYSRTKVSKLFDHEILMPMSEINSNLQSIVETWLNNADRLRSTYDLFFASFYRPDVYLETRFLTLMRALESFHRSMKQGKYLPNEEYDVIRQQLIASIPNDLDNDLRQSLKTKFKYGNEYSLRKRVKELFNDLSDELTQFVTDDKKTFSNQIVDWRNDLTHYDIDTINQKLDFKAILFATRSLRIFLIILLLKSLQIDEDTISRRISKTQKWRSLG